jgi:flagellar biosynthesis chaperone FliJ
MKRFVWRLQRVLDIKIKEEQIKRAELLKLTEMLTGTRGELLMEQRILQDIIEDLKAQKPRKRLDDQEFFLRHSAINNNRIKKLRSRIKELESQQREKIAEVLKTRRYKEGLEKLRAETKMQFIKEQEKLEQKKLDEGATIRFVRKILQQNGIS